MTHTYRNYACLGLLALTLSVAGCSTESRQGAASGAVSGAAIGAVGGMVTALVFGGDVGDAAARGAVWGGSTGAVSGGIQGAKVADKNRAAEERKKEAELQKSEPLEYPISRIAKIKEHGEEAQVRPTVKMTVKLGSFEDRVEFTLTDRTKYEFPILVGRNLLEGHAVVDVSQSYVAEKN